MNSTHCDNPACDSWVHGDPPDDFVWVRRGREIFCRPSCELASSMIALGA